MENNSNAQIKTQCVHSGNLQNADVISTVNPIYPGTSYAYLDVEDKPYPRYFNTPNQEALGRKIADLEHAEEGIIFSSGMAAISTTLLSYLKQGDHAVFQKGLYGGTSAFILQELQNFGINYTFTEGRSQEDFENAIQANTRLLYVETPSNPLLNITDIAMIGQLGKKHNILTMIDNTFASPVNQNPLDFGLDLVMHSATKYLGGHSDICAGVVLGFQQKMKPILKMAKNLGGSLNAETCYLLERSVKTLAIRVAQQNINAQVIAQFLEAHPLIHKVYYPGLENHPGYAIAKQQMQGFGGMLSFELKENIDPVAFQKSLKIIAPSMSLGSVESTICAPYLTSHVYLSAEQRQAEGIQDSLLRLSVGIEDTQDLMNDLEQAIQSIAKGERIMELE